MKNRLKKTFTLLLVLLWLLSAAGTAYAVSSTADTAYSQTRAHLSSMAAANAPICGSIGGEWMVIGLARSGADTSAWAEAYYDNVKAFVDSNINASQQLHKNKSSENSRVILGLTALGYDVTDVGGHNLLEGLTSMTYLKKQGINGPIWALIAFDSHAYNIPVAGNSDDQVTRDKLIDYILSQQLTDGGWALSGTSADPDMTGMAVQSLAPYYGKKSAVTAALNNAITCMTGMISEDGSLSSWGTVNSESCAQVITALTALGIDPSEDTRFIKPSGNLIDTLLDFYVEDCGFAHVLESTAGYTGGAYNQMATEQAFYALTSWYRLKNGAASLYDMTDVTIRRAQSILYGDVNGDGYINSIDAAMVYAYHNGKVTLTEGQLVGADVTKDGDVNSVDAAKIYAYHNGKISEF